jgi:hypothetical protein
VEEIWILTWVIVAQMSTALQIATFAQSVLAKTSFAVRVAEPKPHATSAFSMSRSYIGVTTTSKFVCIVVEWKAIDWSLTSLCTLPSPPKMMTKASLNAFARRTPWNGLLQALPYAVELVRT